MDNSFPGTVVRKTYKKIKEFVITFLIAVDKCITSFIILFFREKGNGYLAIIFRIT